MSNPKDLIEINSLQQEVRDFLWDVRQQIQYKPAAGRICLELLDHIEDKSSDYQNQGIKEEEAYRRAVQDMGEPAPLGVMLNEEHKVRTPWPLVGIIGICLALGLIRNFYEYGNIQEDGMIESILYVLSYSKYFFIGSAALFITAIKGYPWIVRKGTLFTKIFFLLAAIITCLSFVNNYLRQPRSLYMLDMPIILLSLPILMVFAYGNRQKGYKGLFLTMTAFAAVLWFTGRNTDTYFNYIYKVIFMLTGFIMIMVMVKGFYFKVSKIRAMLLVCLFTAAIAGAWNAKSYSPTAQYIQLFFQPEKQAFGWSDDGYNGVLVKELLSRAEPVGEVKLTQEEMAEYKTTEWYFSPLPDDKTGYLTRDLEYLQKRGERIDLTNILPQHYHNNYRIAFWILHYGLIPAIILLAGIGGMCVMLFFVSFRIRNHLGRMISLCCSMAITWQVVFYVSGNLGYQLGKFPALPFISEGLASCTANMILAGIVISAYRYDRVVAEEDADPDYMQKRSLQWNMKMN